MLLSPHKASVQCYHTIRADQKGIDLQHRKIGLCCSNARHKGDGLRQGIKVNRRFAPEPMQQCPATHPVQRRQNLGL